MVLLDAMITNRHKLDLFRLRKTHHRLVRLQCRAPTDTLMHGMQLLNKHHYEVCDGYVFTGVCLSTVGVGACVVARGMCMVAGGCVDARGMHGLLGGCVVAGGHAWLLGGICVCRGACMVKGGMLGKGGLHSKGGHVWWRGACVGL